MKHIGIELRTPSYGSHSLIQSKKPRLCAYSGRGPKLGGDKEMQSPGPSYQTPAVKGMRYAVSTCHVSNSFNMNFATEPIRRHSSNCETKKGVQTKIAMLHLMKCLL